MGDGFDKILSDIIKSRNPYFFIEKRFKKCFITFKNYQVEFYHRKTKKLLLTIHIEGMDNKVEYNYFIFKEPLERKRISNQEIATSFIKFLRQNLNITVLNDYDLLGFSFEYEKINLFKIKCLRVQNMIKRLAV